MCTMRLNLTKHSRTRDDIFSKESDTYQKDAALCANTKELDGAQTNAHDDFLTKHSQMPMPAENIDRAHALTCAPKKFLKDFLFRKFLRQEKIDPR